LHTRDRASTSNRGEAIPSIFPVHDSSAKTIGSEIVENSAQPAASRMPPHVTLRPIERFQCTWESCHESKASEEGLINHLLRHAEDAKKGWNRFAVCQWRGCKSKAKFRTQALYNMHLTNIHTNPLLCNASGCTHKKPFRNADDLRRHMRTAHTDERQYGCPYEFCEATTKVFARKDKWLQHIRETEHQDDAHCPYFHCSIKQSLGAGLVFAKRDEIVDHFKGTHSRNYSESYECGLGSCGLSSHLDYWSRDEIMRHLERHHGLYYVWRTIEAALRGSHSFRAEHVASDDSWTDCDLCGPEAQPEQNESLAKMFFIPGIDSPADPM